MYEIIPQSIPQARRAEINEKILADIESGENRIPRQTIYNCYTGVGGLHDLNPDQFANYHEYACAKREFEQGQFFTPHALCRQIVSLAASDPTETVLDMGCGMGNFFNFLPNLHNAYGFDIDPRAVKVAGYLYPEAHISVQDMQQYEPAMLFDLLLGNPPFNLKFGNDSSQFYYFRKAYSVLKPAGLLLCIVPCSFLQSEFWDKSQIRYIDNCFSFLGQTKLPQDTFEDLGVAEFATKLVVFSRESAHIESRPYREDEFITQEQLRERIARFREIKCSLKLKLRQETNRIELEEEQAFEYTMTKYLYEIKTHPHLRPKYEQAIALVSKFRSQTPPENASKTQYEEYQRSKLTYAKVLAILRRYVREQHFVPQRKVALVKTNYSYKLKAYAPHLLDDIAVREVPIYKLTINNGGLPDAGAWRTPDIEKQYRAARRVIGRKHREYLRQSIPYFQMPQDGHLTEYIIYRGLVVRKQGRQAVPVYRPATARYELAFPETLQPAQLAAGVGQDSRSIPLRQIHPVPQACTQHHRRSSGAGDRNDLGAVSDSAEKTIYPHYAAPASGKYPTGRVYRHFGFHARETEILAQTIRKEPLQQTMFNLRRIGRTDQRHLATYTQYAQSVSSLLVQNTGNGYNHTQQRSRTVQPAIVAL